ncbi:MAG: excinuclease ABC subunit A, partial [Prevotella sp.]|nr:excinuclease ABC subunit A [Prevotella sp.]
MSESIEVKGARVNNLKNIDVKIPRNEFVVIAGVSGSGKSSLAFDTLYAEGQRRYVESLSSYARQFLGRMNKPECDFIRGIPPAIAIEQKVISRNPRSTVGTTTEIYEYLRLLFARIGRTYSPISGSEVKKHSTEDVIQKMLEFSKGTRFVVLAPIYLPEDRTLEQQLKAYILEGYSRIYVNSTFQRINEYLESTSISNVTSSDLDNASSIYLVIDRLSVDDSKDVISRLVDSSETAFYEGHGELRLMFEPSNICYDFSTRFEADGISFEEPNDQMFSFNSPAG